MNIYIVTPGFKHQNSIALLTPLLIWQNQISEAGFNFKFSENISDYLEGDLVILDSKFHRNEWIENQEKIFKDFSFLKKKFNKIIYCDTADSSGWIQSEVFQFIDRYWKLQILKDKEKYLTRMYDRRIYTDYYYKKFLIKDDFPDFSDGNLKEEDLQKIEVFWNSSMADFSKYSHYYKKIYKYLKFNFLINFKRETSSKRIIKTNEIFAKFNFNKYRETIKFHRISILKHLKLYEKNNFKLINRINYLKELSKSKISISPFGWGEIAYRDFETFLQKTILLKPNMNHIYTWPNLYKENETYIDFKWDFEDLNTKIDYILTNFNKINDIATNGFENYRKFTYDNNSDSVFVNRLNTLLKKL